MTEFLLGILTNYLLKLKNWSLIAWGVLIALVTVLLSAYSGTLGFPLPVNIQAFIQNSSGYVLPFLLLVQTAIVAIKDGSLAQIIKISAPTGERGLSDGGETAEDIAKKALKY